MQLRDHLTALQAVLRQAASLDADDPFRGLLAMTDQVLADGPESGGRSIDPLLWSLNRALDWHLSIDYHRDLALAVVPIAREILETVFVTGDYRGDAAAYLWEGALSHSRLSDEQAESIVAMLYKQALSPNLELACSAIRGLAVLSRHTSTIVALERLSAAVAGRYPVDAWVADALDEVSRLNGRP